MTNDEYIAYMRELSASSLSTYKGIRAEQYPRKGESMTTIFRCLQPPCPQAFPPTPNPIGLAGGGPPLTNPNMPSTMVKVFGVEFSPLVKMVAVLVGLYLILLYTRK